MRGQKPSRSPRPADKFPASVQYANATMRFLAPIPENMEWAVELLRTSFPLFHQLPLSDDAVWFELRRHQPAFREFLQHLAFGLPPLAEMWVLIEHQKHVSRGFVCEYPGHPGVHGTEASTRVFGYDNRLIPQDVMDPFYWEVAILLQRGQDRRLKVCCQCRNLFLRSTDRAQRFCSDPCRRKAHPIPKQVTIVYQQRYRAEQYRKDLAALEATRAQLKSRQKRTGIEEVELSVILESTGISPRRGLFLCKWAEQSGEGARIAALRQP
jgi:hypothetical protein